MVGFPEPTTPRDTRAEVLSEYLAYFRTRVVETLRRLTPSTRRHSVLPSGWTPLQLAWHLRCVEHRWLDWRFLGENSEDPWADETDGVWSVPGDLTESEVLEALLSREVLLNRIVAERALSDRGAPGPRWDGAEPATLERILLHLLQEYARHLGQLDIVAEMVGLPGGE